MKPLLVLLMLLFVVPAIGQENGLGQSKYALIGTWKLISATDTTDKGEVVDNAYGLNPIGFLTYTADGGMMVLITDGERKPLSVPDRVSAPAEERAQAFATMNAYAGRYTVSGDKMVHHIEAASLQNIVSTDSVRTIVKLEGGRVTLRTAPFLKAGQRVVEDLVFERM